MSNFLAVKRSGILSLGMILGSLGQALGQVIVDNSFGASGALPGPDFLIPDSLGKTVGGNLFHSFSEFSVPTGGSATFTGPDAVLNILGRVTGSKVSEIDGLIQSEINGANLYLLNPNGFLFGENARVDVDGAFNLSSRDRINLGKDGVFTAVNPDQSVFTASQPQAFGFLGTNPAGKITFDGTRLVTGGQVNIAGGQVLLDKSRLVSEATGDDHSGGIIVQADAVTILDSQLRSQSVSGNAGKVIVSSKGQVLIEDPGVTPDTGEGVDRGEFIDNISNRDVAFGDETGLLSLSIGGGATGGIEIGAPSISLKSAGLYSLSQRDAEGALGQAGSIKLQSSATLLQYARIQFGSESASKTVGGIDIHAQAGASISRQSYLYSLAQIKFSGGAVDVHSSLVEAETSLAELAGDIKLKANSAWRSSTIGVQAANVEVLNSDVNFKKEAVLKLGGDLVVAKGSRLRGDFGRPSTLSVTGKNMTVNSGSSVDAGLGIDIALDSVFGLLNDSRVQVGIDPVKFPEAIIEFPDGQRFGHLNLKAGRIAIAPGEAASEFMLFTPYGGTMSLVTEGVLTIESRGEVYLMDKAANPESKMIVKAGGMLVEGGGLQADEIDIDVVGQLQIGNKEKPTLTSGIIGGVEDPRLVDITAGGLSLYGNGGINGGIVLIKEGYNYDQGGWNNNVYGGQIRLKVGQTLLVDGSVISTRGRTSKYINNNIPVGSIDIDAGNLVLQKNSRIEMPSGEVPEGVAMGTLDIEVANLLRIQNSKLAVSAIGSHSTRTDVSLSAKNIELNSATLEHLNYFSEVYNQGDLYLRDKPEPVFLTGYGSFDITANATLVSRGDTIISMQNGEVKMAAGGILLDGATVETETHWLQDSEGRNSQLELRSAGQLLLHNSRFAMETISSDGRQVFSATAPVVQLKNSQLTLTDEVAGKAGAISIVGNQSLLVEGSEISSIGMNTIDAAVNGNNITVGGGAVTIKSSVINTTVRGAGNAGRTKLAVTKSLSFEDSWIGGAGSTLGGVRPIDVATDGSWGEVAVVGGAEPVDGSMGLTKGGNRFFSFESLSLFNGQQLSFENLGENDQRVIARVTGGEPSVLDGTINLGAKPIDLLLMNPFGFEVGPNAKFSQMGELTLFAGNAIEFDGGSVVDLETNLDLLPDSSPTGFISESRGDIQVIGATLGQTGSGLSIIGGSVDFRSGGSALSGNGSDVSIDSAKLSLTGGSLIGTVSSGGQVGGMIQVRADEVTLQGGNIRTVSAGGAGGAIQLNGKSFNASGGVVQSIAFGDEPAGPVSITMEDSIRGDMNSFVDSASYGDGGLSPVFLKAASVVLDGPDFVRASGVRMIAYQGPTSTISIEGDQIEAPMGLLINEARADASLSIDDGYGSISLSGNTLNLGLPFDGKVEKSVNPSLTFYTHSKNTGQTGNIRVVAENDLQLGTLSVAQEGLLLAGKGFVESAPEGRGSDVLFQGKNVIAHTSPKTGGGFNSFDSRYTGNLTFAAQDQLTLGLARYIYVNAAPSETHAITFKGRNVSLGLEEKHIGQRVGTTFLLVHEDIPNYAAPKLNIRAEESVTFQLGFQTNDDFDTVGSSKGIPGGHGVSAVDIQASDILFNASKLSLHSNFEHRIAASGTLKFLNHSQIEIKDSDVVKNPSVRGLTVKAGTLEMDKTTYLGSVGSKQYPAADWWIEADSLQLDGAQIFSVSLGIGTAGNIDLDAGELVMTNGARVQSLMRDAGDAGSITAAAETIHLSNLSVIQSGVPLPATGYNPGIHGNQKSYGDAGDVSLSASSIQLNSRSSVSSMALDIGRSGNITLTGDDIRLDDRAYIASSTDATLNIGNLGVFNPDYVQEVFRNGSINLVGGNVSLSGGSFLKSTTRMPYRLAGNISITGDELTLSSGSSVVSNTEPTTTIDPWRQLLGITTPPNYGDAGEVGVKVASMVITGKSRVASDSFTDGNAGRISIQADSLEVSENARVYAGALNAGAGGTIEIAAGRLDLTKRGAIVADVRDTGDGGTVHVEADEMTIDAGSVYGSTSGEGQGSRVRIESSELRLLNGGRVESAAFGPGQAGELDISAEHVTVHGQGEWFDPKDVDAEPNGQISRSGFVTSTVSDGDAGTIHLNTPDLNLDAGLIGSASTGKGAAGSINVNISGQMALKNDGQVSVRSSLADGGDITINTSGHVLVDDSELSGSAKLDGGSVRLYGDGNFFFRDGRITAEAGQDGGNIFVEAPETLVLQRSRLSANAIYGSGGYILITADGFLPSIETSITASSEFGVQGTVEIRTPDTDVGTGLVVLPQTLVSKNINLAERCALRLAGDVSSFFLNGDGGIPVWSSHSYLPTILDFKTGE